MAQIALSATVRNTTGKQAAKRLRREMMIPAILYGTRIDPLMLSVSDLELKKILRKSKSENIILGLNIETDKGIDRKEVMLKELQVDPVKDKYIHADFHVIAMDEELTINVPIRLVNIPVGVGNGGILQHVRREISISCLPKNLIDELEADVSLLDIGDSLHIGDINIPENIKSLEPDHLTIAVIAAPKIVEEEEEEELLEEEIPEGEAPEGEEETSEE